MSWSHMQVVRTLSRGALGETVAVRDPRTGEQVIVRNVAPRQPRLVDVERFFMEARVARDVKQYLTEREQAELHSGAEQSTLTHAIPTENKR